MNALGVLDAVSAFIAQLAVPNRDPVNEPEVLVPVPNVTISSPLEPDFFIKARPSYVFKAISPRSREEVVGILPGTAERRNFKN